MVKKDLTVYFDMDGVLADFDKDCKALSHLADYPWLQIPGFFKNLDLIDPGADMVISILQVYGFDVKILTAVDNRGEIGQARANDKIAWVRKHLPSLSTNDVIIVPYGEKKTDYIVSPIEKSILVDDYKVNLHNWKELGGIAVKFGRVLKPTRPYLQINRLSDVISIAMDIVA